MSYTLLEAVNRYIRFFGELPVSSIADEDERPLIVVQAIDAIDEADNEIQLIGLKANTEYEVNLVRDGNNEIVIPTNALYVETEIDTSIDPVRRGTKLYDRKNKTYEFSKDLKAKVIYKLDFADLGKATQAYIIWTAIKNSVSEGDIEEFQRASVGEIQARKLFMRRESDRRNSNMLNHEEMRFVDHASKK